MEGAHEIEGEQLQEGEEGEEGEEGGSDSDGSQSSISYDEGSYDGRAGKIVYSCKDDEAIADGTPGGQDVWPEHPRNVRVVHFCMFYMILDQ